MYTGLIAKRYAKALFDFALSNGEDKLVYAQVLELIEYFAQNASVKEQITSPVIAAQMKKAYVLAGVKGEVCNSLQRFVDLVMQQGREEFLVFMLHSYTSLYKEHYRIAQVELTVAAPLGEGVEEGIANLVQKNTECSSVQLRTRTDESIIGGFVLRIDDMQMDASVAAQLGKLKNVLLGKL